MGRLLVLASIAAELRIGGELPVIQYGVPYVATLHQIGGTGTALFSEIGALPAGITFTDNHDGTATVAGTATITSGEFPITVNAFDSDRNPAARDFVLVVIPSALEITGDVPDGREGIYASYTYVGSGGYPGYTFAITGGAIPPGRSLSGSGTLDGSPTTPGAYAWQVTMTDSHGQTITLDDSCAIAYPVLSMSGTAPTGEPTLAYDFLPTIGGGNGANNVTVSVGALPGWATLNAGTGRVTGATPVAGTYSFTLHDLSGDGQVATLAISITITAALAISGNAPDEIIGIDSGYDYGCTGGSGAKTYAVSAGALPPGRSLSTAGHLHGAPTTPGAYTWDVTVTDALGATATLHDGCAVTYPVLSITGSAPVGEVGLPYDFAPTISGGDGTNVVTISAGALPSWGAIDGVTGEVTDATAVAAGASTFTIHVASGDGQTATLSCSITIVAALAISGDAPDGDEGIDVGFDYSTTDGYGAKTFAVTSGALPPGRVLSAAGHLHGAPTTPGDYTWEVTATDSLGATSTVADGCTIFATFELDPYVLYSPDFVGDDYYDWTNILGGSGAGTYTNPQVSSGTLPPGTTVTITDDNTAGVFDALRVEGTLITPGDFNYVLSVDDANGATAFSSPQSLHVPAWPVGALLTPRNYGTATLLDSGLILIAGGWDDSAAMDSAELYDPATSTSVATSGNMTQARSNHYAIKLSTGDVLLCGGDDGSDVLDTCELYRHATDDFVTSVITLAAPQEMGSAGWVDGQNGTVIKLDDGRFLIVGGSTTGFDIADFAQAFNEGTHTWTQFTMSTPRIDHAQTILGDGRVLIAGGQTGSLTPTDFTDTAEIFDPSSNTFSAASTLPTVTVFGDSGSARVGATGVMLQDGRGLVVGGYSDVQTYRPGISLIYDGGTDAWSQTANNPSIAAAQPFGSAFVRSDGTVLALTFAFGGHQGAMYLYDAGADAWSQVLIAQGAPPYPLGIGGHFLTTWRASMMGVQLPSGSIYLFGGNTGSTQYQGNAYANAFDGVLLWDEYALPFIGAGVPGIVYESS